MRTDPAERIRVHQRRLVTPVDLTALSPYQLLYAGVLTLLSIAVRRVG
jgi:hypothetical protein